MIIVEAGESGRGLVGAFEGKADIGMASRELNPKEKALFAIPIARSAGGNLSALSSEVRRCAA